MTDPQQGTTLHFVVPSPDGRSLLTQAGSERGALRLPERSIASGEEMVAPILAATTDLLGPDVPPLRIAPIGPNWDHETSDIVVETEGPRSLSLPPGHEWRLLAAIRPEHLARTAIREPLGRWLDERSGGMPSSKRPVWSRPGFVAAASEWMAGQLDAAGTPLLAAPRLTNLWGISAFLEGETAGGKVFLKSCAAIFATEPEITLALDRALPGVGPPVVAIESERRWLLMRDVGGRPLGDEPPDRWASGLAVFGVVQRSWREAANALPAGLQVELEDRTPVRLAEALPRLIDDPALARLTPADRERLRVELPRLVDACHELVDLWPLEAIVHGDFHPWNVHVDDERISIIDWSDSAIGHPFFDLPTFLGRTRDAAARRQMLDVYLAGWSDDFELVRRERAAQDGLVLGCMYQVESYRRIIESLDPDDLWDLDMGAPSYVRRALAWLDGGLEAFPED